jgi:hypothetical protein
VENYRRQPRASTDTDQSHTLIQHAENEILISNSGKINRYVTVGLELLEVKGSSRPNGLVNHPHSYPPTSVEKQISRCHR